MTRFALAIACLFLYPGAAAKAQLKPDALPKGAIVLESRQLIGLSKTEPNIGSLDAQSKKNPLNYAATNSTHVLIKLAEVITQDQRESH